MDGQTARLDQANGRVGDLLAMADSCQARQTQLLADLKPKRHWWSLPVR